MSITLLLIRFLIVALEVPALLIRLPLLVTLIASVPSFWISKLPVLLIAPVPEIAPGAAERARCGGIQYGIECQCAADVDTAVRIECAGATECATAQAGQAGDGGVTRDSQRALVQVQRTADGQCTTGIKLCRAAVNRKITSKAGVAGKRERATRQEQRFSGSNCECIYITASSNGNATGTPIGIQGKIAIGGY